jgi:hypothetical protein
MSQKNEVRHPVNCQITAQTTDISAQGSSSNVPLQKRKEDAKQTLYINRI